MARRALVDREESELSVRRQCELLSVPRSGLYYVPTGGRAENLEIMRLLDEQYTRTPFYGSRRMAAWLGTQGFEVNRKRVIRLLGELGLEAVYPGPKTTQAKPEHKVYPYLLRGLEVTRPCQVWCTDITYVRMRRGFVYLVAVMDWYSRYVLSFEVSNTMDVGMCLSALERALGKGTPEIFNTDQGSQFTSIAFTQRLLEAGIQISMDGRGRALDNVFIERLWRSVKYEEVYLKDYETVREAWSSLRDYFSFYNDERLHQSLGYRPPRVIHCGEEEAAPVPARA